MQVFDERTTAMHWHIHKGGAGHHRKAVAAGARIEVAVAIGCDPVTNFAACLPLPEDLDELIFAGFLRGRPVAGLQKVIPQLGLPAHTVGESIRANADSLLGWGLVGTRAGEDNWQREGNDLGIQSKWNPHVYPAIDPELRRKLEADSKL